MLESGWSAITPTAAVKLPVARGMILIVTPVLSPVQVTVVEIASLLAVQPAGLDEFRVTVG